MSGDAAAAAQATADADASAAPAAAPTPGSDAADALAATPASARDVDVGVSAEGESAGTAGAATDPAATPTPTATPDDAAMPGGGGGERERLLAASTAYGSDDVVLANEVDEPFFVVTGSGSKLSGPMAVRLSTNALRYQPQTGRGTAGGGGGGGGGAGDAKAVDMEDILGAAIDPSRADAWYVVVNYYVPKAAGCCGCGSFPTRTHGNVTFRVGTGAEDHLKALAERWVNAITRVVRRMPVNATTLAEPTPPPRRMVVFVNPVGGSGKAQSLWSKHGAPVFAHAGIEVTHVLTEYQNHATDYVREMDLSKVDGLVACGGDGMLAEVVQGLFGRADATTAIRTPLGILPGGSGNGLAASICWAAKEAYDFTNCAFYVARGRISGHQVQALTTGEGKRVYSFLSFSWAIIADIDIESEKWRCCGGARFTVGAVVRAVALRKYRGRVSYLPLEHPSSVAAATPIVGGDAGAGDGEGAGAAAGGSAAAGAGESKSDGAGGDGRGGEGDGAAARGAAAASTEVLPRRLLPKPGEALPDGWKVRCACARTCA